LKVAKRDPVPTTTLKKKEGLLKKMSSAMLSDMCLRIESLRACLRALSVKKVSNLSHKINPRPLSSRSFWRLRKMISNQGLWWLQRSRRGRVMRNKPGASGSKKRRLSILKKKVKIKMNL